MHHPKNEWMPLRWTNMYSKSNQYTDTKQAYSKIKGKTRTFEP